MTNHVKGRLFGGLTLAAFGLYGIGSSVAPEPLGLTLVSLNSAAVGALGLIGYRAVRSRHRRVAAGYLLARTAEAVLLAGGIALTAMGDVAGADTRGYLLGMSVLGAASVPFCRALEQEGRLPRRLAQWGAVGYAALAAGAVLELTTGRALSAVFAVPGGVFELVAGLFLLRRGFARSWR